jgi:hypothetical protein
MGWSRLQLAPWMAAGDACSEELRPGKRRSPAGWIEYWRWRGQAGRRRMRRCRRDAHRRSLRSRLRLGMSIAARRNCCGMASTSWSRRPTSRLGIARCSSGIPTGICWRCMQRFEAARPHAEELATQASRRMNGTERACMVLPAMQYIVRCGAMRLLTMRAERARRIRLAEGIIRRAVRNKVVGYAPLTQPTALA